MQEIAGIALDTELLATAGLSVALAAFLVAVLRVEVDLPLTVGLLVVPSIVGLGFGLAVALRVVADFHMLYAIAVLSAVLVGLLGVYEVLKRLASDPPPPSARYSR